MQDVLGADEVYERRDIGLDHEEEEFFYWDVDQRGPKDCVRWVGPDLYTCDTRFYFF